MINQIEFAFQHDPHFSRLRRIFGVAIYIPFLIAVGLLTYPEARFAKTVVIFDTFMSIQHLVGWPLFFLASFFWLTRYLRYGVATPFSSAFRLFGLKQGSGVYYGNVNVASAAPVEPAPEASEEIRNETSARLFAPSVRRLSAELSALGRRNVTNLVFGIATAIMGVALIASFLFSNQEPPTTLEGFAVQFGPRLSLATFIEVFAYFFLRLYKEGLAEIKYYQNELTNIESRTVALEAAERSGDRATQNKVISLIARTERNGILEKGQTTAAIQLAALENKSIASIIKSASEVIKPTSEK
jgi:hypothetical protein